VIVRRRLSLVTALAILVACRGSSEGQRDPAPSSAASSTSGAASASAPAGHLKIEEAPAGGDVEPLVRDAITRADAAKRHLVVYVGATWCEPCQRFHHAAAEGKLDDALPDVDVLAFDLDRDNERLASAGYVSKLIPLFALPAPDGTASGRQVEGGIKGEGAVGYITPRIKSLLGR
jgi:hypothetical protein